MPSQAAKYAEDGDVVVIASGDYRGDVAVWRQNNLTIRGVGPGAHLRADGQAAEGKAIWVIKGNDVSIENVEFSGASVPDRNGAGIRSEGRNLNVERCIFHDNENGILSGGGSGSIKIVDSIFHHNGYGDGQSHNIYIGAVDRLEVTGSHFHHAKEGHQLKSRARENWITYNWLADEKDGFSSYLLDLPNGGSAFVIGNVFQQGPNTSNYAMLSFSAENKNAKSGELYVINNTFVNNRHSGIFLQVATPYATVHAQNNIFFGKGEVSNREIRQVANLRVEREGSRLFGDPLFVNADDFDFRLAEGSQAIDAGQEVRVMAPNGESIENLMPLQQFAAGAGRTRRPTAAPLDAGAFEFQTKSAASR